MISINRFLEGIERNPSLKNTNFGKTTLGKKLTVLDIKKQDSQRKWDELKKQKQRTFDLRPQISKLQ